MPKHIYVDGASKGNPGPSGWAAVCNGEEFSGGVYWGTNNYAEMRAVLLGLLAFAERGDHIVIYTDSQNCIGWLSKGWRCNIRLLRRVSWAIAATIEEQQLTVEYVHVKGHSGNVDNELANTLAQEKAKEYR